jgi:hypothetical protein
MATLTISGTISFPVGGEANPPSRPFSFVLNYEEKNTDDVKFTVAATDVSLLGRIADAKACFVECLTGGGDLKVNGATEEQPLKAGQGFWCWCNPEGGLTSLTVSTAGAASFRIYSFA